MMCTILSASVGGLASAFLKPIVMGTFRATKRYDIGALTNGVIAGLVSITGVCDRCDIWSAAIIGLIGSVAYTTSCKLWMKMGIDDPIEASQVHGVCGIWGVVAVGIFDNQKGLISSSKDSLRYLGWQMLGLLAIATLVTAFSVVYFLIMRKLNLLRVPLVHEIIGLDVAQMGSAR